MRWLMVAGLLASACALTACTKRKEPAPEALASSASASAAPAKGAEPSSKTKLFVKVTGMIGQDFGQPVIKYANWTNQPILSFELRVYSYDGAGKQLSTPHTVSKKPLRPIRPGEIREIETDLGAVPSGATVELVVPRIVFVDQTEWRDDSVAPEQRPKGG